MAMKKCRECGHEVARTAKTCPNCGANLDVEPDAKARARCEYCRAMVTLKS